MTTDLPATDVDAQIATALLRASAALAEAAALLAARTAAQPPGPAGPERELLRIHEVSEMTGVAVNTLRNWRQAGTGPESHRVGSRVVYREADVQAWLQSQLAGRAQPGS